MMSVGKRISERELYIPSMKIMSSRPGGFILTEDLISELNNLFKPDGKDAEILNGRNDTYFDQKVRNMKSHKTSPGNFIAQGYVEGVEDGFRITDVGIEYLKALE